MRIPALMLLATSAAAQPMTTLDCLAPHAPLLRAERFYTEARGRALDAFVELRNPQPHAMRVSLSLDIGAARHQTLHSLAAGQTARLWLGEIPLARWQAPVPPSPAMLAEATVISCGPAELR